MKLLTELNENLEFIAEEVSPGVKEYYIQGIFLQGDLRNRNGRVYPSHILEKEVQRYVTEFVDKNRALGELGHPEGPTVNLDKVSHLITELSRRGNDWHGKAKILPTPMGNIVKGLMDSGVKLGVSSRGLGSIKTKNGVSEVQEDFFLATAGDIVADPSAPEAFVQNIMEGTDWEQDDKGLWRQKCDEFRQRVAEEKAFAKFEELLQLL